MSSQNVIKTMNNWRVRLSIFNYCLDLDMNITKYGSLQISLQL
jgi:hypothetical protein